MSTPIHSYLGNPITQPTNYSHGEAIFHERGIIYYLDTRRTTPYVIQFQLPLLGNPDLVKPDADRITFALQVRLPDHSAIGRFPVLAELCQDRFYVREIGSSRRIPIHLKEGTEDRSVTGYVINRFFLPEETQLKNRQLYDLQFRNDDGSFYGLSPHFLYTRSSWKDFGLIHATDIHVSKRVDTFKSRLMQAWEKERDPNFKKEREQLWEGIQAFNNWNDRFRDLIRYANRLHERGQLDGIIATGDLVDYLFEEGEDQQGGGNFAFFRNLILGRSPYPDSSQQQEELQVPIFTTLGNHDYRPNPYPLLMDLEIGGVGMHTLRQYGNFNLTESDAIVLHYGEIFKPPQEATLPYDGKPEMGALKALDLIEIRNPDWYDQNICPQKSYVVRMGENRLIMLDSGPDTGYPEDIWEAIKMAFTGDTEDLSTATSAPNTRGYSQYQNDLVQKTLVEAKDGVVIIGTHSPPINTRGTEYPYYFRETQHESADVWQVAYYLRHPFWLNQERIQQGDKLVLEQLQKRFPDWPFAKTRYFKTGKHENQLDFGVSRGEAQTFLEIAAGKNQDRPVDLILFGHVHTRVEMRMKWNTEVPNGRMEYYFDFYTENPRQYYPSQIFSHSKKQRETVHIEIQPSAQLQDLPVVRKNVYGKQEKYLSIPPFADPLSTSRNPRDWWEQHRPIFMQSAPLGPADNNQRRREDGLLPKPNFQGCKYIRVENNVIKEIQQVSTYAMRAWLPTPGKSYFLVSKASQLYLNVKGGGRVAGTGVWQYYQTGSRAQSWQFEETPWQDHFFIKSDLNGLYLTKSNLDLKAIPGVPVVHLPKATPTDSLTYYSQIWQIVPTDDGYFNLQSIFTGNLDVTGGSRTTRTLVQVYGENHGPAQRWKIKEVPKTDSTSPPRPKKQEWLQPLLQIIMPS